MILISTFLSMISHNSAFCFQCSHLLFIVIMERLWFDQFHSSVNIWFLTRCASQFLQKLKLDTNSMSSSNDEYDLMKTEQNHQHLPSSQWVERTDTVSWREPDLDDESNVVVLDSEASVWSPRIKTRITEQDTVMNNSEKHKRKQNLTFLLRRQTLYTRFTSVHNTNLVDWDNSLHSTTFNILRIC